MDHPKSFLRRCLFALLIVAAANGVAASKGPYAFAQQPGDAPASKPDGKTGAGDEADAIVTEAPFMGQLEQLSSILGSMHFLRTLCGEADGDVWRDKVQELIDAQKPSEADRRRLVASFNAGYRGFEAAYRQCTPAARTVINRYRTEGLELAREIATRYGN